MSDKNLPEIPDLDDLPELPDPIDIPDLPDEIEPIGQAPAKATKPVSQPRPQPVQAKPAPRPIVKPKPATPAVRAKPPAPEPKVEQPPVPTKPKPELEAPAAAQPAAPPPAPPVEAPLVQEGDADKVPATAAAGAAAIAMPLSDIGTDIGANPGGAAALQAGERPPLRVLDKAPLHLRKAAMLCCVGSILPWMGANGSWITAAAAKAAVLLGVWFWYKQVEHNWGPALKGFLGKLGDLSFLPKKKVDDKPKRPSRVMQAGPSSLEHPFPTGLHVLSLVTILAACVALPLIDKGVEGTTYKAGIAMAEIGMLAWAAYTWVHIYSYERWGKFNPIFPLMFLAMVFAGVARVVFGLGAGLDNLTGISGVAGGGIIALGGGLAAYTIVEAMMQAKKEGDVKKQAQIEARKAARQSRRQSDS